MAVPSDKPVLLHGDLHLTIIQARDLPNMDLFSERLRRCFAPCGLPLGPSPSPSLTRSLSHTHNIITSDPYVTVLLSSATVARTRVLPNDQNPVWNEHFLIPVAHRTPALEFQVKDNDVLGAQLIGTATIPAHLLLSQILIQDWFPILGPSGRPPNPNSALLVSVSFRPPQIIAEDLGVPGTYFPVRKGGMVTLYQDAHVRDGELPEIELDGGRMYKQRGCWEDICHAILDAHRLIYIVGWSIYDKVRLVREAALPKGVPDTLGELLKYKSEEGVRVCLLVWDDKTSHDKLFLKTRGVMQTHDEETRKFFKHSSVICAMSPRYGSNKLSIFKQQVVGTLFTHHQKCLLVDTPTSSNMRKITAFIGGLDLCDGRYDTPQHRLFRDLNTVFVNDIHNPTFPGGTKGPRQPWHDLHCKIEGPAAYDVLKNFEQRWRKATRHWAFKQGFKRVSHWRDDALIKLDRISWIVTPSAAVPPDDPSIRVSEEEDSENWNVQVFRSIDSGSVKGFPTTVHDAEAENLVCGKDVVIDKSIHTAYVKAIRSAQNFIYIENQYFIGSSYGWPSYKSADAGNLIPMELALKIVSKIRARERFAVYIVIPMWPEGPPTAAPTQEILFWQGQTMKMMYEIIGKELQSMNFENAHPWDYLNFYCLGNREELPKNVLQPMDLPSDKSTEVPSQKFRRFMIYVHAKGMIVDDEYVLLGSANINQRSLDGSRDTEIAMGAYQPHYTWAKKQRHPHGQVYGYRMSLWAEHLGSVDPRIKEPHTLECVSFVNQIAEDNWSRYTTDRVISLNGHLLKYPIKVDIDGKVTALPGHETFPDVGGKVLGEHSTALPDELTM